MRGDDERPSKRLREDGRHHSQGGSDEGTAADFRGGAWSDAPGARPGNAVPSGRPYGPSKGIFGYLARPAANAMNREEPKIRQTTTTIVGGTATSRLQAELETFRQQQQDMEEHGLTAATPQVEDGEMDATCHIAGMDKSASGECNTVGQADANAVGQADAGQPRALGRSRWTEEDSEDESPQASMLPGATSVTPVCPAQPSDVHVQPTQQCSRNRRACAP